MKRVIKKKRKTGNRDFSTLLGEEVMLKKVNVQKENPFRLAEESRFYSERIEVKTLNQSFYPSAFVWRGQRYLVNKIIHSWPDSGYAKSTPSKRDWRLRHHRNYFVVRIDGGRVFKIYQDRGVKKESPRVWILNEELFISKPREPVSSKMKVVEKKRNENPKRFSSSKVS